MIASSTYEMVLKCPECVNLLLEFHKDPFWERPYLMCTSTNLPSVPAYCSIESYVDDSSFTSIRSFSVKDIDSAARKITEPEESCLLVLSK